VELEPHLDLVLIEHHREEDVVAQGRGVFDQRGDAASAADDRVELTSRLSVAGEEQILGADAALIP
jgi:hypothetical protein